MKLVSQKSIRTSALALLVLAGGAMPLHAESLSEAVQSTVSTHPTVAGVANNRMAVDEELNQAHGLYLPQLDFRGDLGIGWSDRRDVAPGFDDGDILGNAAAQFTLQQMLFDGFNAQSEVKRQENRVRSAAGRVQETAELVALDTTEAYLNVLRSRQLLEAAEENLKQHNALRSDIQRRLKGGAGNKADVQQADARVSQAEAARSQIEGDLRAAEASYKSLTGNFPGDLTRPSAPADFMPASLEEAVQVAMTDNPAIGIRADDINVAKAELKQTQSTMYPQLTLESTASRQKDIGGLRAIKDEMNTGLVMRWNLYRGGADEARKREFTWRKAEAGTKLAEEQRKVEENIRRAWAARDAARDRAERFAQQVNSNKSVLSAYKKQFTAGERTLLDVLDAQNELFISNTNLISSYYTALFGDYQLLSERGALLRSLNVTAPETASVVPPSRLFDSAGNEAAPY